MANFPYSEDRPRPCLSPARRAPTAVVDPYSFPPSPQTFARPPVYHSRPLLGHIFHGRGSPDAESEDESGKSARAPSLEAKTARRPSPREDMMMADAADTDFTAAAAAEGRGGRPGGGGVVLRLCRIGGRWLLPELQLERLMGWQRNERGAGGRFANKKARTK